MRVKKLQESDRRGGKEVLSGRENLPLDGLDFF